jgi:hypothetical protein
MLYSFSLNDILCSIVFMLWMLFMICFSICYDYDYYINFDVRIFL